MATVSKISMHDKLPPNKNAQQIQAGFAGNLPYCNLHLVATRVNCIPQFLYFEYTKGILREVDKDLGMSIVMSFDQAKKYDGSDKNTDFEIGLMNPGFVNIELMKESSMAPKLDNKHALVSFLRPQSFVKILSFGIWNQDGFLVSYL